MYALAVYCIHKVLNLHQLKRQKNETKKIYLTQ